MFQLCRLTVGIELVEIGNAGDEGCLCHHGRFHDGEDAACSFAVADIWLDLCHGQRPK